MPLTTDDLAVADRRLMVYVTGRSDGRGRVAQFHLGNLAIVSSDASPGMGRSWPGDAIGQALFEVIPTLEDASSLAMGCFVLTPAQLASVIRAAERIGYTQFRNGLPGHRACRIMVALAIAYLDNFPAPPQEVLRTVRLLNAITRGFNACALNAHRHGTGLPSSVRHNPVGFSTHYRFPDFQRTPMLQWLNDLRLSLNPNEPVFPLTTPAQAQQPAPANAVLPWEEL